MQMFSSKLNHALKTLLYSAGILLLFSCSSFGPDHGDRDQAESYSFFVAGHTYGGRGMYHKGLHPPFQAKFDLINERGIELGFLTGDIVVEVSEKDWDEVDSVLRFLDAKVYFAAGNHDVRDREMYERRYGKTYFEFSHKNDLFILLDPNLDRWMISGEQLDFLKNTVAAKAGESRNIFVLFHQLLWWDKANKYKNVRPNSTKGKADSINFWTEIEPIFRQLDNEVFMFAGDMGGTNWSDVLMYDQYDNITFVASGMGRGDGDNFIIANVKADTVDLEVISLEGADIHAMGNIINYMVK
jgi:hypothetical protein